MVGGVAGQVVLVAVAFLALSMSVLRHKSDPHANDALDRSAVPGGVSVPPELESRLDASGLRRQVCHSGPCRTDR